MAFYLPPSIDNIFLFKVLKLQYLVFLDAKRTRIALSYIYSHNDLFSILRLLEEASIVELLMSASKFPHSFSKP
jgi:hypothetical protein